jgi:hypothetical protein
MAFIGNNADTLLQGLSDFWLRYFKDLGDIQAAYEGTEILFGQVYLDLLSSVLNSSVVDTPLFNKSYYKLITARGDQLKYLDTGDNSTSGYYIDTILFNRLPVLQNKVFQPTATLEQSIDYLISKNLLLFFIDPTNPALNGYASRSVQVITGGSFSDSTVSNWFSIGARKGDTLEVTTPGRSSQTFLIVNVGDKLALSKTTPAPKLPQGSPTQYYSWKILRTRADGIPVTGLPHSSGDTGLFLDSTVLQTNEITFWALDPEIDQFSLYNTLGHFFSGRQRSTEAYRAFVRGILQLYALGPAIDRVESALSVAAGLPVVRDNVEVLVDYDSGLDVTNNDGVVTGQTFSSPSMLFDEQYLGGYLKIRDAENSANVGTFRIVEILSPTIVAVFHSGTFVDESDLVWEFSKTERQTVKTDLNTYYFDRDIPLRSDLKDPSNYGILTFRIFEPLSVAIRVTDYVKNPEWWHNIVIPQEILPTRAAAERQVTIQLFPVKIGSISNAKIGDIGFNIGADENGVIRDNPYRHSATFILMDQFLKMHLFSVSISPEVDITGVLIDDLKNILRQMKPAHTNLYFEPFTSFSDVITRTDELSSVRATMTLEESIDVLDNTLLIDATWSIGDAFKYSDTSGGDYVLGSGADYVNLIVGGANPAIQPNDLSLVDRPIYVTTRPADP